MEKPTGLRYRLGHDYRDTGSISDPSDQILRWLNADGRGIRNMGGIRPIKFRQFKSTLPAAIVLVTHHQSRGTASNPWEDLLDLRHGRVVYWGDAKFSPTKAVDDWIGNRALAEAWGVVLDNQRHLVPPILYFSKPAVGLLRFNGLCVLDRLELTWFEDQRRPVRNYRAHLSILDEEFVDVDWIHARALSTNEALVPRSGPESWRRYLAGSVDRLRVWAPSVRTVQSQLPEAGTPEARVLAQLAAMDPTTFEAAMVALFRQIEDVRHEIHRTRRTGDGGFDFYGTFSFPPPLDYEVEFLGEAKRYARTTAVTPKDVSRLVARLGRGQYGIFATTSYFTTQAQEEVLADSYPATLISGADLIRMMRELRVTAGDLISEAWLDAVRTEMQTMTSYPELRGQSRAWIHERSQGFAD